MRGDDDKSVVAVVASRGAPSITVKRGRGRPSTYTEARGKRICTAIENRSTMADACRAEGVTPGMFLRWVSEHPELRTSYARALNTKLHLLIDELPEIADESRNDYMERQLQNGSITVLNIEHIARTRLRVDTRKFLIAQMMQYKYLAPIVGLDEAAGLPQPPAPLPAPDTSSMISDDDAAMSYRALLPMPASDDA